MYKGRLKSWNDNRGFGFIKLDELNQDTFIHISTLKAMSRKPKIGDFIYFEIDKQADGKTKAVNCRIEGVAAKSSRKAKAHIDKNNSARKSKMIMVLIIIAIFIFAYQRLNIKPISLPSQQNNTPKLESSPVKIYQQFQCDGRQYCSQMNSRAEAEFFSLNCPNTKMDGDSDGIPCENDTRF
jgi:cold shock CspA family protein